MNTPNDEQLKAALKEWNVSAPLPPRFQEGVWRRIEEAEVIRPPFYTQALAAIDRLFARPALAYAYVMILLAIGLAAGYIKSEKDADGFRAELATRYVQTIDPYHKAAD